MTGINLTIIVETIIFAIFFLIIDRLIWQPFLKNIEEREKNFSDREKEIEDIITRVNQLNQNYFQTIKEKESKAQTEIETVTKLAYMKQRELLEKKHRESRAKLVEYKEFLKNTYCLRKEEIAPYIDNVVEEMYNAIVQRKHLL